MRFYLLLLSFLLVPSASFACSGYYCGQTMLNYAGCNYPVTFSQTPQYYYYSTPQYYTYSTLGSSYYYTYSRPATKVQGSTGYNYKFLYSKDGALYFKPEGVNWAYPLHIDHTSGEPLGVKKEGKGLDVLMEMALFYQDPEVRKDPNFKRQILFYNKKTQQWELMTLLQLVDKYLAYYKAHYQSKKPLPTTKTPVVVTNTTPTTRTPVRRPVTPRTNPPSQTHVPVPPQPAPRVPSPSGRRAVEDQLVSTDAPTHGE